MGQTNRPESNVQHTHTHTHTQNIIWSIIITIQVCRTQFKALNATHSRSNNTHWFLCVLVILFKLILFIVL